MHLSMLCPPSGVRHLQTADCILADYISCYLYEYMLYIPIPLSIPIPIPIPIYLYLYEALVWLTEVLVWLTQARVCKSAVCKCRTPMPEGEGGTLIRNKNLESNFLTLGIRFQFKVPHLREGLS